MMRKRCSINLRDRIIIWSDSNVNVTKEQKNEIYSLVSTTLANQSYGYGYFLVKNIFNILNDNTLLVVFKEGRIFSLIQIQSIRPQK